MCVYFDVDKCLYMRVCQHVWVVHMGREGGREGEGERRRGRLGWGGGGGSGKEEEGMFAGTMGRFS